MWRKTKQRVSITVDAPHYSLATNYPSFLFRTTGSKRAPADYRSDATETGHLDRGGLIMLVGMVRWSYFVSGGTKDVTSLNLIYDQNYVPPIMFIMRSWSRVVIPKYRSISDYSNDGKELPLYNLCEISIKDHELIMLG
jgi:hypothetical protein